MNARQIDATAFQARVLADAWLEGERRFWERRAAAFEWAAPRAGDYMGRAGHGDMLAASARCAAAARACRAHGGVVEHRLVGLVETLQAAA